MSSRNFRKLCGSNTLAPDSDDSDGHYDPPTNRHIQKSTFEGLELSSSSETESEVPVTKLDDDEPPAASNGARKKTIKNKGKGKKSAAGQSAPRTSAARSSAGQRNIVGLDEIDKSLMEVNALLGAPQPIKIETKAQTKQEEVKSILAIEAKHLNVVHELWRLFGPDDVEEVKQRDKTQPHRRRLLRKVVIRPTNDTTIYDFKKTGLSMSVEKHEGDIIHFVYDHDEVYQKMHHAFLLKFANNLMRQGTALFNMDDARKYMHVEPLMEIADTLFRMDENSLANEIIENVMTYLQYVAHPSFNLASTKVRLSYYYLENRPFHVAMLKYMYLLTNKACHRTALEIAKMLLNLDPKDPLAVVFIIDTIALRAREHQWLVEAIEYFNKERKAKLLINIQYSNALAHFHIATKNMKPLTDANKYLQDAIMSHPEVVLKIMEFANMTEPKIQDHSFFKNLPSASESINELIMIYAKMTWPRWREPQVMPWFIKNIIEVTESYDNNENVRKRITSLVIMRNKIFQTLPTEILRHIATIRSMSNLLLETPLRATGRPTSGWDPIFDRGLNRYSYRAITNAPRTLNPGGRALLYEFFTSLIPSSLSFDD